MNRNTGMKLFLAVFMCALLVILPVKMRAATVYTEGDFYYEIREESVVITGYFGSDEEVSLPGKIAGYPVSGIASGAFENTSVKTLSLPDTIMEIEENAIAQNVKVVYESADHLKPSQAVRPGTDETKKNETKTDGTKPNESETQESRTEETRADETKAGQTGGNQSGTDEARANETKEGETGGSGKNSGSDGKNTGTGTKSAAESNTGSSSGAVEEAEIQLPDEMEISVENSSDAIYADGQNPQIVEASESDPTAANEVKEDAAVTEAAENTSTGMPIFIIPAIIIAGCAAVGIGIIYRKKKRK